MKPSPSTRRQQRDLINAGSRLIITGALAAGLLGAGGVPASATTSQETDTSFALIGGSLSITVQTTATLSSATTGAANLNGKLGSVTVNDARASTVPWSAFASSTAFTGPGTSRATGLSYTAGVITTTGVSVITPGTPVSLTAASAKVAGPTSVVGNNTATWNPTVTVSLPDSALVGTYTGTVTTSVS